MAYTEFPTFYCDVGYDAFDLRNLQCRALQRIGAPLDFGNRSDDQGNLLKSAFTTDPKTKDLLYQFEIAVGFTQKIQIAKWVDAGNFFMILDDINDNLFPGVKFEDRQQGISPDEALTLGCYLTAFSRRLRSNVRPDKKSLVAYRQFGTLGIDPIQAGDLAEWLAVTYRVELTDHLELWNRISRLRGYERGRYSAAG